MTAERWRRVEEIFHHASDLPASERAAYVSKACGEDAELAGEVESLLAADSAEGSLVEAAITDEAGLLAEQQQQSFIGRMAGPYRILSEIGTGGMGAVYLARRDDAPEQQVAVKLIRLGMDTEFVLNRFGKERQILSRLDHPHIARFLESGVSDDGRPYFAMEYVPGVPINRYCDAHNLSIEARLKLFQHVCGAAEYAHRKLTVHRDLKPTNILVTAAGVPKLLDFGIAKMLIDEAASGASRAMTATLTMMRMMTPDYASPEQVRGDPSTTATDVYSLGVILYELIAGKRPRQIPAANAAEVLRVLTEVEPEPASEAARRNEALPERERVSRHKQIAGDLDGIVAKAMRTEPSSRYPSVAQLSSDIQRFLDGRPVQARQGAVTYCAVKFLRRHRVAVAAGVLASASLAAGTVASLEQARRSERRFEQIRKLAHHFVFDFYDRLAPLPGSVTARELMVKTALDYLDRLRRESRNDPSLELELAMAYQRIGDVQGSPDTPSLGLTAAALESYRRSIDLYEAVAGRRWSALMPAPAPSSELPRSLILAYFKTGDLLHQSGASGQALGQYRKGLDLALAFPDGPEAHPLRGMGFRRMGNSDLRQGRLREAAAHYQKALESFEKWEQTTPGEEARRSIASCHSASGTVWIELGDISRAAESYQKSTRIREELVRQQPRNVLYRRDLLAAYVHVGDAFNGTAYFNLGEPASALEYYRKALQLASRLMEEDPRNALAVRDAANVERKIANQWRDSDPKRAVEGFRRSSALVAQLLERDPNNTEWLRMKELAGISLGYALARSGDSSGAIRTLDSAIALQQELIARDPARASVRHDMQAALIYIGDAYMNSGQTERANQSFRRSVEIAEEVNRRNPTDLYSLFCLANSYERMGDFHARIARRSKRAADWQQASQWFGKGLAIWQNWNRHGADSRFNQRRRQQVAAALAEVSQALKPVQP